MNKNDLWFRIKYILQRVLIVAAYIVFITFVFINPPLIPVDATEVNEKKISKQLEVIDIENLKITITFDDYPHDESLKEAFGFSCFVEGGEQNILFDTGDDGKILMHNLRALNINTNIIEIIFLSHEHGDHINGLSNILEQKSDIDVYITQYFSKSINNEIRNIGSNPVQAKNSIFVTRSSLTSGGFESSPISEHSLFINTTKGVVVITGCSHPGIVNIVEEAQAIIQKDILLVLGGFHLREASNEKIHMLASKLKGLGVQHISPMHCSGLRAKNIFKKVYGKNYLDCGVGSIITVKNLQGTYP